MSAWHDHTAAQDHTLLGQCLPPDFYTQPRPIGLAVSGGSDSLAMLYLVAELRGALNLDLRVATVDHGLRPEAGAEATIVGEHARALGLAHDILRWTPPPKEHSGNLMEAASAARYAMLALWAQEHGARDVLIAHTADDQAETFLMALARAAGLDGLSGMAPMWKVANTTFHRPLLGVTREALRRYLRARNLAWIDDPSNDNHRYTRVRMRAALRALAPLGITGDVIAQSVGHLAEARLARDRRAAEAFTRMGYEKTGALHFDHAAFCTEGRDVQRRLLTCALQWFSGARHPARGAEISRFLDAALTGRSATLQGVELHHRCREIELNREERAAKTATVTETIWDHRWHIRVLENAPEAEVRALGAEGLAQRSNWRDLGLARRALLVTPAFWQGERLVYAPLLDRESPFTKNWHVTLHPSFGSFIISH